MKLENNKQSFTILLALILSILLANDILIYDYANARNH